jgi:hypothetical protein
LAVLVGGHGGGGHGGGTAGGDPPLISKPVPGARVSVSNGHGNLGNVGTPRGGQKAYPGLKGRMNPQPASWPVK